MTTMMLAIVFLGGLGVLLYPTISNFMYGQRQSLSIERFFSELEQMSAEDNLEFFERAHEFNRMVANNPRRWTDAELERIYHEWFDFTGRGIIGVLEISNINVRLPIYLGTSDAVLHVGIGHLEGSSFPVGGPSTHSSVSGHRGLPSSLLLTNADRLVIGDVFTLTILNERLYYQIDQIQIVLPGDMSLLGIYEDEDFCTVLTCTPYGVNSHRLLMRGFRIFPEPGEFPVRSRAFRASAEPVHTLIEYAVALAPIMLIILIIKIIKIIKSIKNKLRLKAYEAYATANIGAYSEAIPEERTKKKRPRPEEASKEARPKKKRPRPEEASKEARPKKKRPRPEGVSEDVRPQKRRPRPEGI